jgi:alpha-L-rhamnosidase
MRKSSPYYSGATWEYVALDGTPGLGEGTSLAHGWASGPTSALSKYVLGVRPVKPGYRTWLIEPQTGDLTWAEGTVPTPFGPIGVEWRKTAQGIHLEINVPEGTSGTIAVPTSSNGNIVTDNGRPLKKAEERTSESDPEGANGGRPGYIYLEDIGAGPHSIEIGQ